MTADDHLPAHLERIGLQLTAAAEDLYGSTATSERQTWLRRQWATLVRAPRIAVAGGGAGLVAAVAVTLVIATTGAPPAYALTANSNGSYTLTMNDIATAVPQVNAEFQRLGIKAVVIPVTPNCTAPDTGIPLLAPTQAFGMSQSVTIDNANISAGDTGFIAAEQTPSGVRFAMGTTDGALPACINSNQPAPVITPGP
ncbi:MAG: hypothetical protein ACRDLT_05195 [Solirubrobacteraceae bacterium]